MRRPSKWVKRDCWQYDYSDSSMVQLFAMRRNTDWCLAMQSLVARLHTHWRLQAHIEKLRPEEIKIS